MSGERWAEKSAYYRNVPASLYFKLRVTSSYGVESEKSFRIIVLPPWWQTWWAYIMYVLLLALSIWSFIKMANKKSPE